MLRLAFAVVSFLATPGLPRRTWAAAISVGFAAVTLAVSRLFARPARSTVTLQLWVASSGAVLADGQALSQAALRALVSHQGAAVSAVIGADAGLTAPVLADAINRVRHAGVESFVVRVEPRAPTWTRAR
ncbi:MAG: hypothetical protein JST92_24930 [Deltaproteobacteria bacterium]|nr:hypothetical protein [Deltaproteobacteria bacterium]